MDLHTLDLSVGLSQVEELLREAMASDIGLLAMAGEHVVAAGGKRLRPLVVLGAFHAMGGENPALATRLAAAVELIHTASLIHDDINDRSTLRRGESTINARWGNSLALLAGDFVFVRMLQLIADLGAESVRVLADACQALVEGETLQALALHDTSLSEQRYLEILELKTAALFATSAHVGGLAAAALPREISALCAYGHHLGVAYQIRDDTLDLISTPDKLGKPAATDLAQGKLSLAVIHALHRSDKTLPLLHSGDADAVRSLLSETGAIAYAMGVAQEHAARSVAALSTLPPSRYRDMLEELADHAAQREH